MRPKGSKNKPKEPVVAPAPKKAKVVISGTSYLDTVSSECDDIASMFPFQVAVRNEQGVNPHIVLPFKYGHFVRPERFGRGERIFCFKSKANMVKFKELVRMK